MEEGGILKKLLTGIFLVVLAFWLSFSPQSYQAMSLESTEEALTNPGFSLPIIPGGAGFGMGTPAGSGPGREGGAILRVTTLAEDGPGSLREALLARGPRIVVFDVSGYIQLKSNIIITNPYLTIAGQTAPSPGITLKGAGLRIATHDVLVQHIRIRVGDSKDGPDPRNRRAIIIENPSKRVKGVYNVVVDHVSASWAVDETFGTWYRGVQDITVTNCIMSEGLWHSINPDGTHSTGFLVGDGTHRLSVIGNLFAHNDQRNMFVHGDTSTLFVNNLIYNWYGSSPQGGASVYGSDRGPIYASIVGNAYVRGRNTRPGNKSIPISVKKAIVKGSKFYLEKNKDLEISDDPWASSLIETRYNILAKTPPIWIPSLVIKKSEDVKSWVLSYAGARPRDRDNVDLRIINDVKNGTGRIIDSQDDVGGWPPLANKVRGTGGILALSIPSNEIQPSGYTKVEEWLHSLARQVED
jgi:hypothetical protein